MSNKLSFIALSLLTLFFMSCQGNPYYSSFTRNRPNEADLIGTWMPDADTLKDLRNNGGYDTSKANTQIILSADGKAEIVDMPDWWIAAFGESKKGFQSSTGKWKLDHNSVNNWWEIVLYLQMVSTSLYLRNEKPPYLIHITIGDPDEGHAMVFKRKVTESP